MLFVQTGKYHVSYALSASNTSFSSSWVIDSVAIDLMTHSSHQFITYNPSPRNKKIKVAKGSLATVAVQGTIDLTPYPSLKMCYNLHVPKLSENLLSVCHQITKDLHCSVMFFRDHCIFQYQITGRLNGHAKERMYSIFLR